MYICFNVLRIALVCLHIVNTSLAYRKMKLLTIDASETIEVKHSFGVPRKLADQVPWVYEPERELYNSNIDRVEVEHLTV